MVYPRLAELGRIQELICDYHLELSSDSELRKFIHWKAKKAVNLYKQGKSEESDEKLHDSKIYVAQLGWFAEDLEYLESNFQGMYREIKERVQNSSWHKYFGIRFEVHIARVLGEDTNYNIKHPDPPDFVVEFGEDKIPIECTSIHYNTSDRSVKEKLQAAIIAKQGKEYYHSNTVLFIDITNAQYEFAESGEDKSAYSFEKKVGWVEQQMEAFDADIGCIKLFAQHSFKEEKELHYRTTSIFNNQADDSLKRFIEEFEASATTNTDSDEIATPEYT